MLRLADTVDAAMALLRANGETVIADRIAPLSLGARTGNPSAVQSILSEATGSMGSLRDVILYADGVRLPANRDLERLVASLREQAQDILGGGSPHA